MSARSQDTACDGEQITGKEESVHIGTNNAEREGTMAIVKKNQRLLKRTKQASVGQIILSEILPETSTHDNTQSVNCDCGESHAMAHLV